MNSFAEEARGLYSVKAEQTALGAMIVYPRCAEDGVGMMSEEDFYRPGHRLIFGAIRRLVKEHRPADQIAVEQLLGDAGDLRNVGGGDYLLDIQLDAPSALLFESAAEIVLEKSRMRRLEVLAKGLLSRLRGEEGEESAADLATWLGNEAGAVGGSALGFVAMADIDEDGGDQGVPTGFRHVDRRIATRGMPLGQTTMFIAQEKHGKSTMKIGVAVEQARMGHGVLYVSLADLNPKRLKRRFLRYMCGYSERATADEHGHLGDFLAAKVELERDLDLTLYDRTRVGTADVDRILSAVEGFRQRKERTSTPLVSTFVDYVQKLTSKEFRPSDAVAMANYCSQKASAYAERSGLAIGLGSQLTDGSEKAGRRAITKGSRAWLEDCGLALQLDRHEGASATVEILVSRFGGSGTKVPLIFDEDRLRFREVNP